MATRNLLGDLSLEDTQQAVLAAVEQAATETTQQGVLAATDAGGTSAEEAVFLLGAILSRLGYPDQSLGSLRVTPVGGSTTVSGSLTTVTTVSTVANIAAVGGLSAIYDQYAAMNLPAIAARANITVT